MKDRLALIAKKAVPDAKKVVPDAWPPLTKRASMTRVSISTQEDIPQQAVGSEERQRAELFQSANKTPVKGAHSPVKKAAAKLEADTKPSGSRDVPKPGGLEGRLGKLEGSSASPQLPRGQATGSVAEEVDEERQRAELLKFRGKGAAGKVGAKEATKEDRPKGSLAKTSARPREDEHGAGASSDRALNAAVVAKGKPRAKRLSVRSRTAEKTSARESQDIEFDSDTLEVPRREEVEEYPSGSGVKGEPLGVLSGLLNPKPYDLISLAYYRSKER
jgi:hypothetical protein